MGMEFRLGKMRKALGVMGGGTVPGQHEWAQCL